MNFSRYLIVLFLIIPLNVLAIEVKILVKIDNDIITNIDVQNEYNYLIALNKNLQKFEMMKVMDFAKESLIKEKVKEKEIIKYYDFEKKNKDVENMIKNIYLNLELNSQNEFEEYLKQFNLEFNDVYRKIKIETIWNQFIYNKFREKLIINENEIKNRILQNQEDIESLLLYELVFDFNNKNEIKTKYDQILTTINEKSFEEAIIEYSIAPSKKNSGSLGWVNKNSLSEMVKKEIENLDIGQISPPITIPSGILLIKLVDKKIVNQNINIENEVEKMKIIEINQQLNNLSTMYFKQIEKEIIINEY